MVRFIPAQLRSSFVKGKGVRSGIFRKIGANVRKLVGHVDGEGDALVGTGIDFQVTAVAVDDITGESHAQTGAFLA